MDSPLRDDCLLPGALSRAQEAFYASLNDLRIKDLMKSSERASLLPQLAPGPQG